MCRQQVFSEMMCTKSEYFLENLCIYTVIWKTMCMHLPFFVYNATSVTSLPFRNFCDGFLTFSAQHWQARQSVGLTEIPLINQMRAQQKVTSYVDMDANTNPKPNPNLNPNLNPNPNHSLDNTTCLHLKKCGRFKLSNHKRWFQTVQWNPECDFRQASAAKLNSSADGSPSAARTCSPFRNSCDKILNVSFLQMSLSTVYFNYCLRLYHTAMHFFDMHLICLWSILFFEL